MELQTNTQASTKKIRIDNSGKGMDEALNAAEQFAVSLNLGRKDQFHLRLLAEETLGMARAIVGEFNALFWLEVDGERAHPCAAVGTRASCPSENGRTVKLHLEAKADVDYTQRQELLSVSTEGRNIAPRGIMEKVRELFEAGLHGMDKALMMQAEYGGPALNYGLLGAMDMEMPGDMYYWSMQKYKDSISSSKEKDEAGAEAWDELEKSIVANIADEVQVGVTKDLVELIIIKKFVNQPGAAPANIN